MYDYMLFGLGVLLGIVLTLSFGVIVTGMGNEPKRDYSSDRRDWDEGR